MQSYYKDYKRYIHKILVFNTIIKENQLQKAKANSSTKKRANDICNILLQVHFIFSFLSWKPDTDIIPSMISSC